MLMLGVVKTNKPLFTVLALTFFNCQLLLSNISVSISIPLLFFPSHFLVFTFGQDPTKCLQAFSLQLFPPSGSVSLLPMLGEMGVLVFETHVPPGSQLWFLVIKLCVTFQLVNVGVFVSMSGINVELQWCWYKDRRYSSG